MPSNSLRANRRVLAVAAAALAGLFAAIGFVLAAPGTTSVPAGFMDEGVLSGLSKPTAFAFAPDGRIFVTEQAGNFKTFLPSGSLLDTTMVTSVNFLTFYSERGLVGLAIDPAFNSHQHVYLYYTHVPPNGVVTSSAPTFNRLSRFTVDGSRLLLTSEVTLMDQIPAPDRFHLGGDIHVGPDGMIWLSTGDGWTTPTNAPNITSPNGKILRLKPDGTAPADNPFYHGSGLTRDFVWAKGFRNPWRFAFNPLTNLPFIGDVGEDLWEELDAGQAGADYGWPAYEGPQQFDGPPTYPFTAPITYYQHANNCTAIIAGDFVQGPMWPADYQYNYFYSDLNCGRLWRMQLDANNPMTYTNISQWADAGLIGPVTIRSGPDGYLYYLAFYTGELRRIRWLNAPVPGNTLYLPMIRN